MTTTSQQPDTASSDSPSLFHRLAETPLLDLLRGRLTARLDINSLLIAANLPADITSLIHRVVRRTRLWRIEKVDVAKELTAHFRDALTASGGGASSAALLTDFGDERQAAKLIRRAKRRQRPLIWHAWRRSLQAVGGLTLLLICTYAYLAAQYWSGAPKVTHDYLADVNAAARAVPKDQAAWPHYREALLALPRDKDWDKAHNLLAQPGDWDWPPTAQAVRDNQASIAKLRDAALMPGLGFQASFGLTDPADAALLPAATPPAANAPVFHQSLFAVLMPQLSQVKRAASWLAADARTAALDHDGARALHDIRAILGVARHSREIPFLINDLVFVAIAHLAADVATQTLADSPDIWTDDQLRELAHSLAALRDDDLHPRFDGERFGFADFVQRVYTDDGAGNGRVARDWAEALADFSNEEATPLPPAAHAVSAALGPVGLAVLADRRDLMREYDRLMGLVQANAARPMWQRPWSEEQLQIEQRTTLGRARYSLLDLLFPAFERAISQFDFVAMARDTAITAIALERFHRARGVYPDSLAQLAPDFLPAPPLDRYDGKPIKYRAPAPDTASAKPLLYSIGNDRADNGGRLYINPSGAEQNESAREWLPPDPPNASATKPTPVSSYAILGYDWILYPPVRTPRAPPLGEAAETNTTNDTSAPKDDATTY